MKVFLTLFIVQFLSLFQRFLPTFYLIDVLVICKSSELKPSLSIDGLSIYYLINFVIYYHLIISINKFREYIRWKKKVKKKP